jgi:hypothetical protein
MRAVAQGALTSLLFVGCGPSAIIKADELQLVAVAAETEPTLSDRYVIDVRVVARGALAHQVELKVPLPVSAGGQRVNLLLWEVDALSEAELTPAPGGRILCVKAPKGSPQLRLRVELELADESAPLTPGPLDPSEWLRIAGGGPVAEAAGESLGVDLVGTLEVRRFAQN